MFDFFAPFRTFCEDILVDANVSAEAIASLAPRLRKSTKMAKDPGKQQGIAMRPYRNSLMWFFMHFNYEGEEAAREVFSKLNVIERALIRIGYEAEFNEKYQPLEGYTYTRPEMTVDRLISQHRSFPVMVVSRVDQDIFWHRIEQGIPV